MCSKFDDHSKLNTFDFDFEKHSSNQNIITDPYIVAKTIRSHLRIQEQSKPKYPSPESWQTAESNHLRRV